MSRLIESPFPVYTDVDGNPLEDGYIYIGEPNLDPETNPKNAYWDEELTSLVTQPVRTKGGYPFNGSFPARLFVDGDYSILIQNKRIIDVYSSVTAPEDTGGGATVTRGTLGESVSNRQIVYFDTDGKLYVADNRETLKSFAAGIALSSGVADDEIRVQKAGELNGFTGLTAGTDYWLGTTGDLVEESTLTGGTNKYVYIGRAISTTELDANIDTPNDDSYLQYQIDQILTGEAQAKVGAIKHFSSDSAVAGMIKFQSGFSVSQSTYSVLFAENAHKYDALQVLAGNPSLAADPNLFYPTPPPTDDGYLKVYDNPTNTAPNFIKAVPDGFYKVKMRHISNNDISNGMVRVDSTLGGTLAIGVWDSGFNFFYTYSSGNWNSNSGSHAIIEIAKLEPETLSTDGYYAFIKAENITASGEVPSALREYWERGDSTLWNAQRLTIPLDTVRGATKDLIIKAEVQSLSVWGTTEWQEIKSIAFDRISQSVDYDLGVSIIDTGNTDSFDILIGEEGILGLVTTGVNIGKVSVLADGTTGNIRLTIIQPNLTATVQNVSDIVEITDATPVSKALFGPGDFSGQQIIGRFDDGDPGSTGTVTFNHPTGGTIRWPDGATTTSVVFEGEGNATIIERSGELYVLEYTDSYESINSSWWKYADGTLKVREISTTSRQTTSTYGNIFSAASIDTFTYSHAFIGNIPTITPAPRFISGNPAWQGEISVSTLTQISVILLGGLSACTARAGIVAIGRWR